MNFILEFFKFHLQGKHSFDFKNTNIDLFLQNWRDIIGEEDVNFHQGHESGSIHHPNAYVVDERFCKFDVAISGDDT